MSLSSKYFTVKGCSKHSESNSNITIYHPKGHMLILRSHLDNRDLGSLHVIDAENISITPIISALPNDETRFQILFGKDRTKAGFVITNLCHEGYIKFDLMTNDKKVVEVNPGGINQVNEVRSFSSYEIYGDFTNSNKQIIVEKKKTSSGQEVSLEDDEKKSVGEKVGDYIYLTITPKLGLPELHKYFESTYWVVPDYIIIKEPIKQTFKEFDSHNHHFESRNSLPADLAHFRDYDNQRSIGLNDGFSSTQTQSVSQRGGKQLKRSIGSFNLFDNQVLSKSVKGSYEEDSEEACEEACEELDFGKNEFIEQKCELTPQSLLQSRVAAISHGDVVKVNSCETGENYMYDLSAKCILGLSIIDKLDCKITEPLSFADYSVILAEYIERLNKKMFESVKLFNSDSCVICMGEGSSLVIIKCGHLCLCSKECAGPLTKCPICRSQIVTLIDKQKLTSCI